MNNTDATTPATNCPTCQAVAAVIDGRCTAFGTGCGYTAPAASTWAVTALEHPTLRGDEPCPGCLAHAETAAVYARATGSIGSTHGDGTHGATVLRQIAVVQL